MTSSGYKSLLPLYLIEILRKYTDFDHRLNQQELIDKVETEFGVKVERKSISRVIGHLIEHGAEIQWENGYFLAEREFDESELRLLIDSLLFSRHLPTNQCRDLIHKLEGLTSVYFKSRTAYVSTLPDTSQVDNKQVFHTIEILDEAISKEKKVAFIYNHYNIDKKLHPKKDSKYIVNPYQMVAANSRYYLISNTDKYHDVSHYRIDHITDIEIIDERVKPMQSVKGLENGLCLPKHMAEHIYMFSGPSIRVHCLAKRYIVNEIIDWFGDDVEFYDHTENDVKFTVQVNEKAFYFWLKQYDESIEKL
ncbi:MAG: hypothetical protein A2Y20_04090 [Firmicutes bacterium GWF2_51_9]|nr:MAG: hypothetical protein A2Y20_04090 [Firmicutes bacterium GWF2_51_9]OGS59609.1 MAG: hypothetical protein A2Y19_01670 [Firmicutes bacterium GWE2_51_13]HBZ41627.1 WYL domain-containing protein [Erysipelotrichaceae bacterium]